MIHAGDYREVINEVADLIFTSPPYNIGSKSPRIDGYRKNGKFDPKSFGAIRDYPDNMPEDKYQEQQIEFFLWAARHLTTNGTLVYNHKPRRKNNQMIHPAQWFLNSEVQKELVLVEEIIWNRKSTHNHGRHIMWPQTERLYVFIKVGGKYILDNTNRLPQRSDLWTICKEPDNYGHNAPFPLALAEAVIEAWSNPGQLVMDPYSGSGSTGIASLKLGRRFIGAEILLKYRKIAEERFKEKQYQLEIRL
jgi:site-specific DNA-methyltransferase (adenine-specific)